MIKGRFLGPAACAAVALLICGVFPALAEDAIVRDPDHSSNPMTSSNPKISPNPVTAIDRATLKGFLERPLFDPARRLPPPPAPVAVEIPAVVAPPEPPPSLQLLGVIHGSRDMAMARRQGDDRTIILRTGDRVGGWTVAIRPPIGLELQKDGRTVDYVLFGKSGDAPATAAADLNGEAGNPPDGSDEIAARTMRLQKRTY